MILIAESELLQIIGLEAALHARGYRVASASTLDAALEIVNREQIEAAVVGLALPEVLDGAALARALEARGVPVIIYTGLSQEAARDALGEVMPAAVLVKPVSDEDLVAAIHETVYPSGGGPTG